MLKSFLNRAIRGFGARYDYDVGYMHEMVAARPSAVLKLGLVQAMTQHRRGLPVEAHGAAKIRAALAEDCGPCVQLAVNMARQAGVSADRLRAVLALDVDALPPDTALAVRFAEAVLSRGPAADVLRDQVVARWGQDGLISLAFAIGTGRLYPMLKSALGHAQACRRVIVDEVAVAPGRATLTVIP